MKAKLALFLFGPLLLLAMSCATSRPLSEPASAPATATASDEGHTIHLRVDQPLIVELEANWTTGYRWFETGQGDRALLSEGRPTYTRISENQGKVGEPGVEIWRYRATRLGNQTLRFEYRRLWEKSVPPARIVVLDIVVQ